MTHMTNVRQLVSLSGRACVRRRSARRAFSLIEMLVALTISSTLLAATLVALDVMFKRYTVVADSASTHVVSRMVMHRVISMIRTGREFGPYPADVLDSSQNPATYDHIEFVSRQDEAANLREVTRIERRASGSTMVGDERIELRGPNVLWMVTETTIGGSTTTVERPLIDGLLDARFTLLYDVGPTLVNATIDLTIQPRGSEYSTFDHATGQWTVMTYDTTQQRYIEQKMTTVTATSPTIRLIASASPRNGDE